MEHGSKVVSARDTDPYESLQSQGLMRIYVLHLACVHFFSAVKGLIQHQTAPDVLGARILSVLSKSQSLMSPHNYRGSRGPMSLAAETCAGFLDSERADGMHGGSMSHSVLAPQQKSDMMSSVRMQCSWGCPCPWSCFPCYCSRCPCNCCSYLHPRSHRHCPCHLPSRIPLPPCWRCC